MILIHSREILLQKVFKLKEFGVQPAQYGTNFLPILVRFVATFKSPHSPEIRRFLSDIDIILPKQVLSKTTTTVTGWINGFHHWDQAGNLLSHDGPIANDSRVSLDSIIYPWRHTRNLPAAYNSFPKCVFFDKGSGTFNLVVGVLGKTITKGAPKDYAIALQKANFTLPATVTSNDHSTLQPLPFYGLYMDRQLPVSFIIYVQTIDRLQLTTIFRIQLATIRMSSNGRKMRLRVLWYLRTGNSDARCTKFTCSYIWDLLL
jgi:hypothetical protein